MAEPKGELLKAINGAFGSIREFQTTCTETAMKRFGSGWAWLTAKGGKLEVNEPRPIKNRHF